MTICTQASWREISEVLFLVCAPWARSNGQDLHSTVTDIDQVYQHFYSFATPYHISAKRPERFLFIVADFDRKRTIARTFYMKIHLLLCVYKKDIVSK